MKSFAQLSAILVLCMASGPAMSDPMRFDTPEAAASALVSALETRDKVEVLRIFGPENEDLISTGNPEDDRADWEDVLNKLHAATRIAMETEDRAILQAGHDFWPFPAPLLRTNASWSFDAEEGRKEVLARGIGRNELAVIDIMRRFGDIQEAYRKSDPDGDGVREFAAAILSSPGEKDGLYWPQEPGGEPSPLDDVFARASFSGYNLDGEDRDPEPYSGYYFRILQAQGDAAPGGAYSYLVNGNMVAGYALVAYPAVYGDTGIMSFMIGENRILYEADLGEDTLSQAVGIESFNPGDNWERSE